MKKWLIVPVLVLTAGTIGLSCGRCAEEYSLPQKETPTIQQLRERNSDMWKNWPGMRAHP